MASLRGLLGKVARQQGKRRAPESLSKTLSIAGGAGLCLCVLVESSEDLSHASASPSRMSFTRICADGVSQRTFRDMFAVTTRSSCEGLLEVETAFPRSFNESDRFFQVLEYHRTLLPDYTNRWAGAQPPPAKPWPRKIPTTADIPALEMDFRFCKRSPNYRDADKACQDLQFRIGAYYVTTFQHDQEMQMKGYRMIKELAEHGHPDGMCYYGIILNEGLVQGIEASPEQAVIWWRRCLDYHKHIQSTYELAIAFYTGEGVPEDTVKAVSYFRKAAHLGHAGSAYMLGELLLDGVGVRRDRAGALEWIVTAAELGHYKARQRVLAILQEDWADIEMGKGETEQEWSGLSDEENAKAILLERRYTIGGGSRNPEVLQRRKTKVSESRRDS